MKIFKRYLPYLSKYKKKYIYIFIGLLLTVISSIGLAYIMKPLMDELFINKDKEMLLYIPIMLITIYIFKGVGRYIQSTYTENIGLHLITVLRQDLLKKIIFMDMDFIYKNRNGELVSRIINDISQIRFFVANMLPELIRDTLMSIGLLSYLIYLNPTLSFYTLVVMPISLFPLLHIAKKIKKISLSSQNKDADIVSKLNEIFNNYEMIKSNTKEKFELENFKKENDDFFKLQMKTVKRQNILSPLLEIIASFGLASVIYIGGTDVIEGKMTIGEFTAFLTAVGLVFAPIKNLAAIYLKVQPAIVSSERVFKILDLKENIQTGNIKLKEKVFDIRFENVFLKYDNKIALENINIHFKKGMKIGIVGSSGSGKSSIINLLLRFYKHQEGNIFINDINIKDLEHESLRKEISIVSQRIYIFNDTLAYNITYGEEIDNDRLNYALKVSDSIDFVNKLENGVNTIMEEFGMNLSGGQRQRISIARAIYRKSSILILDEATSALDNESELKIKNNIKKFSKEIITITIAHRLRTIEDSDNIILLSNGKLIGSGNHNDLMKNSNLYNQMVLNSEIT